MATTDSKSDLDFVGGLIKQVMEKQPRTRRFANTFSAALGAILTACGTILTTVISFGWDLPLWIIPVVTGILLVAEVFGVKATKNGWTPSLLEELQQMQADYIDRNHEHNVQPAQRGAALDSALDVNSVALPDAFDEMERRLKRIQFLPVR